jgi:hypothetical protein
VYNGGSQITRNRVTGSICPNSSKNDWKLREEMNAYSPVALFLPAKGEQFLDLVQVSV